MNPLTIALVAACALGAPHRPLFVQPTNTVPFQPAANTATIGNPQVGVPFANSTTWTITPTDGLTQPFTIVVSSTYSQNLALWIGRNNMALQKFYVATKTNLQNPADVRTAFLWYNQFVMAPFWLPIKPAS